MAIAASPGTVGDLANPIFKACRAHDVTQMALRRACGRDRRAQGPSPVRRGRHMSTDGLFTQILCAAVHGACAGQALWRSGRTGRCADGSSPGLVSLPMRDTGPAGLVVVGGTPSTHGGRRASRRRANVGQIHRRTGASAPAVARHESPPVQYDAWEASSSTMSLVIGIKTMAMVSPSAPLNLLHLISLAESQL